MHGGGVLAAKKLRSEAAGKLAAKKLSSLAARTKKTHAFTLAEVLITLAIIGVVAALTIPVVVSKYQKQQYYTQFMKVYGTLSSALENSIVDNGPVWDWSDLSDQLDLPNSDIMDKYFAPYLKVSKVCDGDNFTDCFPSSMAPIGGGEEWDFSEDFDSEDKFYLLADGSALFMEFHFMKPWKPKSNDTGISFYVDTNGAKGPNVMGRDIFTLAIETNADDDEVNQIESDLSSVRGVFEYQANNINQGSSGIKYANCNPQESNSTGLGCATRLLQEGKMNY